MGLGLEEGIDTHQKGKGGCQDTCDTKVKALIFKGIRDSYSEVILSDPGLGVQILVTPNSMFQCGRGFMEFL